MVQEFSPLAQPRAGLSQMLGQAMGQGINKNLPNPEVMVQRGMLSEAFKNLDPNKSYEEQLQAIVPTLMTTQGGAEALQTLAPIMQQRAKNKAITSAIEQEEGMEGQPGLRKAAVPGQMPQEEGEGKFRRPKPPGGAEPTYPEMTTGPEITPLMSPPELKQYALNLMKTSDRTGTPMSYQEAMQIAQSEQQNRLANNQQIQAEKDKRIKHIQDMNSDLVKRAQNSGMIKADDDEAKTVVEKLGYEARNADTPADRWEYVRSGLRDFESARNGLATLGSAPGPFTKIYRKMIGTYKDKEQIMKEARPYVDKYLKYGLYDEARNAITTNLGFGPEDTELTIFPFSKEQDKSLNKIQKNKSAPRIKGYVEGRQRPNYGDNYGIQNPEEFNTFKNDIANYLTEYPDANLITLRGRLNQDQLYAWEDISKAINELIEEERFIPDNYQYSQLPVIQQSPVPGIAEIITDFWTKTR